MLRIVPSERTCYNRVLHTAQGHFCNTGLFPCTVLQCTTVLNRLSSRIGNIRADLIDRDIVRRFEFLRHSISRLISTDSCRTRTAKRHYTCIRKRNNICRIRSRCRERKVCIIYRCRSLQRYLISCIVNIFNIPRLQELLLRSYRSRQVYRVQQVTNIIAHIQLVRKITLCIRTERNCNSL